MMCPKDLLWKVFEHSLHRQLQDKFRRTPTNADTQTHRSISYTEDNVPVRCLYVAGIKPHITLEHIEAYFKTQGKVESLKFYDKVEYKYAFVTFETYEDATMVLNRKNHFVQRCKLKVRSADTWHQPAVTPKTVLESNSSGNKDGEPEHGQANGVVEFEYKEDEPSLMMLNDDCLFYVLSFLNILDMIQARGTCSRLDAIIDQKCKKYEHFCFEDLSYTLGESELTLMSARTIFQYLGPTMKSLSIDGNYFSVQTNTNRILDIIVRHCKSLETLRLDSFQFNRLNIKKMVPLVRNLKVFSVGESTKCSDDIGQFFQNAHQLEELTISGNWEITGKCLTKTSNLKILSLNRCGNIQSKPFVQALQKNRTLKKLEIERCDKLDDHVVNCILTDLQGIEDLSLSNIYPCMSTYARFGELPNLKKLTIEFHSFACIDSLLENLVSKNILEELKLIGSGSGSATKTMDYISQIHSLTHVSISFNLNVTDKELEKLHKLTGLEILSIPGSENVTTNGVIRLLKACTKIKYLDVSQTKVDNTFLYELIELLSASVYTRPNIELVVYNTDIEDSSETITALLKEHSNRLKVTFLPKILNTFQLMFTGSDFGSSDDDDDFAGDLDDDYDDDGFDFPIDYYGDFQYDSDDSDRYIYGWGRIDPDSPDWFM